MKNVVVTLSLLCFVCVGCDAVRFAPGEAQKQNAWLHNRTTQLAAETARAESASEKLQALAGLSEVQSRAFVSYCGLPKEFPKAESAEDVLAQANFELAHLAAAESAQRPDAWDLADNAIELGIGLAALLGGVYGTKAAGFLKQAREKSKALKEIIEGNELFKKEHADQAQAFKQAQRDQSPATRQLVAQIKV